MNKILTDRYAETINADGLQSSLYVDHLPLLSKHADFAFEFVENNNQPLIMLCPLCGTPFSASIHKIDHHTSLGCLCNTSLNWRAVSTLVSILHSGRAMPLTMLIPRPELKVLGMTSDQSFAEQAKHVFDFENTFYDRQPFFDVTHFDRAYANRYDIIISVNVLEYVAQPVSIAIENLYKMLAPGGVLILSVVFDNVGDTVEYFPELYDFHFIEQEGQRILVNRTKNGQKQLFEDLTFHGSSGCTLEMRRVSRTSLEDQLEQAGFAWHRFIDSAFLPFGVYFEKKWSLPIVAYKATNGLGFECEENITERG